MVQWTKQYIHDVMMELAEENVLACKALLQITEVRLSDEVETLSVSIGAQSVLKVNVGFLNEHATTETDVKTLLMHEFLHILLNHTRKYKKNTILLNIALDSVINSVIHHMLGSEYSDFFDRFYDGDGIDALLRPSAVNWANFRLNDGLGERSKRYSMGGDRGGYWGDCGGYWGDRCSGRGGNWGGNWRGRGSDHGSSWGDRGSDHGSSRDNNREDDALSTQFMMELCDVHEKVYDGSMSADDLHEWLESHVAEKFPDAVVVLIGSHGDAGGEEDGKGAGSLGAIREDGGVSSDPLSPELREIVEEALRKLKEEGILDGETGELLGGRCPGGKGRGLGGSESHVARKAREAEIRSWKKKTLSVLKKCVSEDRGIVQMEQQEARLPMLHPRDRRASAVMKISPFLPFSHVPVQKRAPKHRTAVYLDVSGSMSTELDELVTILYKLRRWLIKPIYTFSTIVEPAVFVDGKLDYVTTGGTSVAPVLEHMRTSRVRRALIITDGYVESISSEMMVGLNPNQIQVLLTSSGRDDEFREAGIQTHWLPELPELKRVGGLNWPSGFQWPGDSQEDGGLNWPSWPSSFPDLLGSLNFPHPLHDPGTAKATKKTASKGG